MFKSIKSIFSIILVGCFSTVAMAGALTTSQVKQVQQVTHDYLLKNPEILEQMASRLQARQQQQQLTKMERLKQTAPGIVRTHFKEIFFDPQSPVVGDPNGSIMIAEFFDYQCGHCRVVAPVLEKVLQKNPRLRIVFKELPIFGGASKTAALAALAAQEQGKYMSLHHALMQTSGLNAAKIWSVAQQSGLNARALKKSAHTAIYQQQIQANERLADALLRPSVGYVFTPVIIVANRKNHRIVFIPGAATEQRLTDAIRSVR